MSKPVDNVLDLIGNTPLLSLTSLAEPGSAQLLGKLEARNPSGSVKDRAVLAMMEDADARGVLKPGYTIVEATGGNFGIAIAMVGSAKGHPVTIVLPEGTPLPLLRLLGQLGAAVHETPADLGMAGARKTAELLVQEKEDYVSLNPFDNPANTTAHREGTAQEILRDTNGSIDAFVAGVGTAGTISGVGEALRAANSSVLVVAVEPASSPLLSRGRAAEHGIPGIGADFVPAILRRDLIDEVVAVTDEQAKDTTARLAREAGLLVGISSGANVFASLEIARRLGPDRVVVT
ncbi:MAG: cysteine synthase family protein, partial [Chloroflexi bacterium]|nr:cysteine synthase family protein [Chloroflexota bacterium]